MLEVTAGGSVDELADRLADVLRVPLPDPMTAEWIVVVSAGTARWLRLALARRLGTSNDERVDGVAANLDLVFPGRLSRRVLSPGPDDEPDPWELERVAWVVLDVLDRAGADERLGPLQRLAPGATRWARARRIADLFDRYLLHRPAMIRQWAAGHYVDGLDRPLADRYAWQPHLWRLARERIDEPSPAEARPRRLADLRDGDCPADVPDRISLFGLTTIPGGAPFVDLLDALGTQRDVHLLLHEPSMGMARHVGRGIDAGAHPVLSRGDDRSPALVHHPLLRSWARPAREGLLLIGDRLRLDIGDNAPEPSGSLLARVQADLRTDSPPAGDVVPDPHDRSISIHSCHGPTRQVEVLRDQILHLLDDDPTLTEDDIVVLCPALDDFAPLIESVLGPTDGTSPPSLDSAIPAESAPTLRYRITDRSLRATSPLLGALADLVELLDSRFSDAAVLDFANLGPVRERFALRDDDITTLADWVEKANTRWGLDGAHRERWGIPASHESGSWKNTVDRLLLGIAVTDDPDALAVGDTLPISVEGNDTAIAGRLADLLGRLGRLADDVRQDRPVRHWVELLQQAAASLFAVEPEMEWQHSRLAGVLEGIDDQADIAGRPSATDLSLADVRHLLGRQLQSIAGRTDFFRGGITISSLTPLRGLPHRVVCLLGMDETAFSAGAPDGDDLVAADPQIGDRDRRADTRQALLETVLAAGDHLVLTRSGHSVVTNQPVPRAVVVAELEDVISATLDDAARDTHLRRMAIEHPRQSFDERNFLNDGPPEGGIGQGGPWSFDPLARAGAAARTSTVESTPLLTEPLASPTERVVLLADLHEFLLHPAKYFLQRILEIRLPESPSRDSGKLVAPATGASGIPRSAHGRDLVLDLDDLEGWSLRDRFLDHRRKGGEIGPFLQREQAGDLLPPGRLAEPALDEAELLIEKLLGALDDMGARTPAAELRPVDVTLADGTRIVGAVPDARGHRPGPVTITVSKPAPKRRLGPWLDLLALTAQDPTTAWASVLLTAPSTDTKKGFGEETLQIPLPDSAARHRRALTALQVVVDLYRRGRQEPLPIFPLLSPALHKGNKASAAWVSNPFGRRDDADRWIQMAFDRADVDRITSLPIRPDDPAGPGDDRASRYAHRLWGAYKASMQDPGPGDAS